MAKKYHINLTYAISQLVEFLQDMLQPILYNTSIKEH